MNSVRASGQIAVIGVLTGVAGTIPVGLIGIQTLSVRGIFVGSVAMFEDMNRAIAANQLRPVIDRVFPFEQSTDALRFMQSAQHFGKIVITCNVEFTRIVRVHRASHRHDGGTECLKCAPSKSPAPAVHWK